MTTTFLGGRPSMLAAACAPTALAVAAQVYALGQPAVPNHVQVAPTAGLVGLGVKGINNYNGVFAAAAVEGTSTSSLRVKSAMRLQPIQADKAKGGDARGNPPRGRRRV